MQFLAGSFMTFGVFLALWGLISPEHPCIFFTDLNLIDLEEVEEEIKDI